MFFGIGVATVNKSNQVLEVYFPHPLSFKLFSDLEQELSNIGVIEGCNVLPVEEADKVLSLIQSSEKLSNLHNLLAKFKHSLGSLASNKRIVSCRLNEDRPPADVIEAYLKLHLISHRQFKPHEINIKDIFKVLPNVAWTSHGAIDLNELDEVILTGRMEGKFPEVFSVDKFPKMTDYVVPKGVRIADTARVRLGAYVGEGTTVMHEGFINFNAGTDGPNMIEGRISAGVMIGSGSDLGGGCSTMGTLSGGGNVIISVGKDCLIGANGGTGIPLGNSCTIESGLYITAGTKVIYRGKDKEAKIVKAAELSGLDDLLFRRNSTTGSVECINKKNEVQLNTVLHSHN